MGDDGAGSGGMEWNGICGVGWDMTWDGIGAGYVRVGRAGNRVGIGIARLELIMEGSGLPEWWW